MSCPKPIRTGTTFPDSTDFRPAMARRFAILARFADAPALYRAAERIRDAGYRKWDTYAPLPVHGLPEAQGLPRSKVPVFTFVGGVTGFFGAMFMVWYMNAFDYPLIVGGKPFFSPVFPFPIFYEMTILLAAFGSLAGMFIMNLLPRHHSPLFASDTFLKGSDDAFLIAIEERDPKFEAESVKRFLQELGGTDIEEIEEADAPEEGTA